MDDVLICLDNPDTLQLVAAPTDIELPTGSNKLQPNKHGKFPCDLCNKVFSWRTSVYSHQRKDHGLPLVTPKHEGTKPFPCAFCDKSYMSKSSLSTHLVQNHGMHRDTRGNNQLRGADGRFGCALCNKSFLWRGDLWKHQRKKHGRDTLNRKVYKEHELQQCAICNKIIVKKHFTEHYKRNHTIY